ncbi:MAG: cytochrome b5 domain-containing protein [Elusimicrobiales bacterium]|nr:cytochrome b5 domain-containing protein [Elusimicrobiales bacterium]
MKTFAILLTLALLSGRAAAQEQGKITAEDAWKSRTFTAEELKKYNGKDGAPAYAAVDGIVYDLSKTKFWKDGQHMKLHSAGTDLSSAVHSKAAKLMHKDRPVMEKVPKVGVMEGFAPVKPVAAAPASKTSQAAVPAPAVQRPAPPAEPSPAKTAPAAAPQEAAKAPLAALHKVTKEELGQETSCPVTGEKIKVSEKTPALDFKGKTYYFSSLSSLQKFSKDPVKLLKDRAGALFKKKKS